MHRGAYRSAAHVIVRKQMWAFLECLGFGYLGNLGFPVLFTGFIFILALMREE
jgi:hypothetical protein